MTPITWSDLIQSDIVSLLVGWLILCNGYIGNSGLVDVKIVPLIYGIPVLHPEKKKKKKRTERKHMLLKDN